MYKIFGYIYTKDEGYLKFTLDTIEFDTYDDALMFLKASGAENYLARIYKVKNDTD